MIEEGEIAERAYIVSEGTCEVFRTVAERTERLRVVGPGGVVGEVGLFTGARRVASVRAVTDVVVLVVTKDALERELGRAGWMRSFVEEVRRAGRNSTARDERRGPPACKLIAGPRNSVTTFGTI